MRVQLVPEPSLRLGDVVADRRPRHAKRAADLVVGELAVAGQHVRATAHGRQRFDGASLHFLQLGLVQLEVGVHPEVHDVCAVERPVLLTGAAVGISTARIAGAGPRAPRGERLERAGLPTQSAFLECGEELDGDILRDVLRGVVIDEATCGPVGDEEDAVEQVLVGGEVQRDVRLHGVLVASGGRQAAFVVALPRIR